MKIAKLISKQVKKRDAVRTAVRKKSYSAAPAKAKFLTPTTGKIKSVEKREIAKMKSNTMSGVGGSKVFSKATSNKKLGASVRAGRGFNPSKVKKMVKEEKKAGYAMNPKYFNSEIKDKGRNPYQISGPNKKVPVKRRGK